MKILHKYVLKEHFGPLTFALAALTSILLLNYIAKQFGTLVGKGLPWTVIGEFVALSIPFTIALTLPMTVLVATLYAFSRLAADNEITALKASGIGMTYILRPVLLASVVVTMIMLFFNDQILPRTNHALAVLQTDIAQTKPTFALREQVINEVTPGKFYLRANHIEERSNWMREVTIYDLSDATKRRTIYADSGTLSMASNHTDLLMVLYSGMMQDVPTANPAELQRLFFHTDAIRVAGVANQFRKSTEDESKGNREMSVCEMQRDVDKARQDYGRAKDILESGLQRARMFKIKLDTSFTRLHLASQPRVTLGGSYCALLRSLKKEDVAPKTPLSPNIPPRPIHPAPGVPHMPPTPQQPSSLKTRRIPTAPFRPALPNRPVPQPFPRPLPGQHFPHRLTPYPGQRPPGSQRPPLYRSGPPPRNMPPAVAQMIIQQKQQQTLEQQRQQAAVPSGLEAERIRLADLQLLIDSNEVEIHKKFALAVACFVFVLLGAPIALRFPRGGVGLTIGVSLFVFALYYVGLIAGASLGSRGIIPPWISMWTPNVIFGMVGVILVGRMDKQGGSVRSGGTWEWLDAVAGWTKRHVLGMKNVANR